MSIALFASTMPLRVSNGRISARRRAVDEASPVPRLRARKLLTKDSPEFNTSYGSPARGCDVHAQAEFAIIRFVNLRIRAAKVGIRAVDEARSLPATETERKRTEVCEGTPPETPRGTLCPVKNR